jgi:hypothetical protein
MILQYEWAADLHDKLDYFDFQYLELVEEIEIHHYILQINYLLLDLGIKNNLFFGKMTLHFRIFQ